MLSEEDYIALMRWPWKSETQISYFYFELNIAHFPKSDPNEQTPEFGSAENFSAYSLNIWNVGGRWKDFEPEEHRFYSEFKLWFNLIVLYIYRY